MIKIFTTAQAGVLDQYTIRHEPIASIDLVERASAAFVHAFSRRYSNSFRVVVFAGPGNNGADALAIARLLIEKACHVETCLFNLSGVLSAECGKNKQRLTEKGDIRFTEVTDSFEPPVLGKRDIVIDGLFGSGLTRPLAGGFAAAADYVNRSGARVVSIDIPSGLFGEDNRENNPEAIIRADVTFTFGFPKLAFFIPDSASYAGEWEVLDIGLHPETVEKTDTHWQWISEADVAAMFRPRNRFAHKGVFGHALLVAGSRGKTGAAILSARACLRGGAGMLTVHVPQRGEPVLQTAFPEAMVSPDIHDDHFSAVPDLAAYTAIGVGPGIGQHRETAAAFERLLRNTDKPMVIDADGLNLLSANHGFFRHVPPDSILTPHPKEFDRLSGVSATAYERLRKARAFAMEKKVIIILKGAYTAVCTPDGNVCFNSSGNPGMATAGSGDVLTGILLGLLAQGYEPRTAALMGVWIHGAAGDRAARFHSEESMLAGDMIEMLGKIFKQLKKTGKTGEKLSFFE